MGKGSSKKHARGLHKMRLKFVCCPATFLLGKGSIFFPLPTIFEHCNTRGAGPLHYARPAAEEISLKVQLCDFDCKVSIFIHDFYFSISLPVSIYLHRFILHASSYITTMFVKYASLNPRVQQVQICEKNATFGHFPPKAKFLLQLLCNPPPTGGTTHKIV